MGCLLRTRRSLGMKGGDASPLVGLLVILRRVTACQFSRSPGTRPPLPRSRPAVGSARGTLGHAVRQKCCGNDPRPDRVPARWPMGTACPATTWHSQDGIGSREPMVALRLRVSASVPVVGLAEDFLVQPGEHHVQHQSQAVAEAELLRALVFFSE